MSSEQKIEQILVELGLTAPRITPAMIDELMREVTFSTHVVPGTTTTVATAIDGAGFTLCTVPSACASPENFNPALGIEIAITKARDAARAELWKLEGYRLKRALHDARSTNSTKALAQIREVLAGGQRQGYVPSAYEQHDVERAEAELLNGSGTVQPRGLLNMTLDEAIAAQPAASPLLTAAKALAVEVGATVEELASGTAQRRQQAQAMGGPAQARGL